jgi:lysophospholipase L1-like esterase
MRRLSMLAATAVLLAGCLGPGAPSATLRPTPPALEPSDPPRPVRYVALGDTFTNGDGLPRQADRWPTQLVRALRPEIPLDLVDNLAGQSHGTFDVIDEQLPVLEELAPDLVTLQVGVNDIVIAGGLSEEEYRQNLVTILDGRDGPASQARAGILDLVDARHVVLVTSPDYTLLPGQRFGGDPQKVDAFNAILQDVATARGIAVVDISPIADLMARDRTLVTDDGRHPSAKQYAGWVELIAPVVHSLLDPDPTPSPSGGPSGAVVG